MTTRARATVTGPATRSSRRRGYGELTRDEVVGAALRLTRRTGLANLSMRQLAAELGSPSMNAYYYVRNKDELLDLVGDAVLGEVDLPPTDLAWDRWIAELFQNGRTVLLGYPGVAEHLLRRVEGFPNEARLYQAISDVLEDAGFDASVSDRTQRVMAYLLFGAVTSELATTAAAGEPATMVFGDDDDVFRFGLDLMIDGLKNRSGPRVGRAAPRPSS